MQHSPLLRSGRRGSTLVEFAVVLNVFLLLIFGIFEFGRLLMFRHLIDNAARDAARYAVTGTADPNVTTAKIQAMAKNLLVGQFSGTPTVQVHRSDVNGNNIGAWDDAPFGERIAVRVDATYRPLIPTFGILPNIITVKGLSIMRSEGD